MNLMLDIETLGTQPGYIVLTVGFVEFSFPGEQGYEEILSTGKRILLSRTNQDMLGLKTSKDTLDWWAKQSEGAQDHAFDNEESALPLKEGLIKLNRYFSVAETIWTFGYMDIAMINTLYDFVGMNQGIFFRKHIDMRTVARFCDKEWPNKPKVFIGHDALHDAAYQAYVIQRIIK